MLRTPTALTGGHLVAVLRPLADSPQQRIAEEAGQRQTEDTEAGPPQPPASRKKVRARQEGEMF